MVLVADAVLVSAVSYWLPLWKSCNHAALVPAVHVVWFCASSQFLDRVVDIQLVTSLAVHSAHCAQDRWVPQVQFLVWC